MPFQFFNSLTQKKEPFAPLDEKRVTLYHCGPTVYDYVHVGNLRAFVFADTLRRALEAGGYAVEQTMNITDVGHLSGDSDEGEDKMTKGLLREGLPLTVEGMHELGTKYMNAFKADIAALNILSPHHMPRASESMYISEDLNIIQKLLAKNLAYETADGVYFDTENFPQYGALPGAPKPEEIESRIHEMHGKKSSRDFALWKKNSEMGFESPYGKGFPGWHIECSAMSMRTLDTETLDIHTGGIDLAPIHHNNEIAQSEGATGKQFARFFMHSAFLDFAGGKMAKSDGNIVRLKEIVEKGFHPASLRWLFLMAHYRTPLDFTWEALAAAQTSLERLVHQFALTGETHADPALLDALRDDLNTPQAIAAMNERGVDADFMEKALGIPLRMLVEGAKNIPPEISAMAEKRNAARTAGDYAASDALRAEIESAGYKVFDTPSGTTLLTMLRA